jgi:hypothetical protein
MEFKKREELFRKWRRLQRHGVVNHMLTSGNGAYTIMGINDKVVV